MAYPLFIVIGLLFDAIILCASIATIIYAVAYQPAMLDPYLKQLAQLMATNNGRLELLIIGAVFLFLSFRGIFLLIFGRGTPEITVKSSQEGTITISHSSIEHILRRIVESSMKDATLRASAAAPAGPGALNIQLRIRIDLVETNLNEYSAELERTIRAHFVDKLGLKINSFKIRAEYVHNPPQTSSQGA